MDREYPFIAKLTYSAKRRTYGGTAVLVSPTHALTCNHVIDDATARTAITLEFPGLTVTGTSPARIRHGAKDLALIEFQPAHPGPVPAWTAQIELGSRVWVAAWPFDEFAKEQKWKHGGCTVSSVNTLDTQLNVSLNRGASGGVILDANDHCAGLLNLGADPLDHSKAIPAHAIQQFLRKHGIPPIYNPKPTHLDHAERYREQLRGRTCHVDLGNLLTERGKREVPRLDEFYAILTTRVADSKNRARKKGIEGFAQPVQPEEVPLQSLLQKHRRILLRGEAGSGKTTFLRRIAWALCRENPAEDSLKLPFSGLPLLVRVRDLDNYIEHAIEKKETPDRRDDPLWIGHFLASQAPGIPPEFFQRSLADRNSVLLIDGLDEAAGSMRRRQIAALVHHALPASGCACVVTTRPVVGSDTAPLADLVPSEIDPLSRATIQTFLRNWCLWYEEGRRENLDSYLPRLERAVFRRELEPLAGNPLMLTLMAIVCQIKQKQLPERRADVYKEVVAYLADLSERRDAESHRDQRARFKARDTVQRLVVLARKMQTGEEPFSRHTLRITESQASQALEDNWISPSEAADFILFAQRDSGILTLRGEQLEFWHRSFQEYLVAVHLAERRDWPLAARLLLDNESRDVLVHAAGSVGQWDDLEHLFESLFDRIDGVTLKERAIAAGVLHQMRSVLDSNYLNRTSTSSAYLLLLGSLEPIFTQPHIPGLSIDDRIQAAEAVGAAHPFMTTPDHESYWVPIQGGAYTIGLTKEGEKRFELIAPRRTGSVPSFSIGRYPVTVWEYERFLDDPSVKMEKPWGWDRQLAHPSWPLTGVSWHDAVRYCEWASKRSKRKIRLPEEHEWEVVARGLNAERQYPWADGDPSPEKANYSNSSTQSPTPVGIFPAGSTLEGAADMAGNVWEWTSGDYDKHTKVLRGGSFFDSVRALRAACRNFNGPDNRVDDVGLRCLRE